MSRHVAAVDCGATSVRVCRIDLAADELEPVTIHRVAHTPRRDADGRLRWDWLAIDQAIIDGLERCLELGPLSSIGVDTWAVDYGLLDDHGELIAAPFSYRDERTFEYRRIVDAVGARRLYDINGLQIQPFNTLFQLAVHDRAELAQASRLLWLPELIVHRLTGVAVTERTSAVSSGLVDVETGDWSRDVLDVIGIDQRLLGDIENAGRVVGDWRGIPVSLVGGHDTASAVAGMGLPSPGGSAFVSTGTWMLAGIERPDPDRSEWARERNYTNEAGALGGYRFLRNITGFWILEQCRRQWGDPPIERLITAAEAVDAGVPIVDVDDEAFRSPDDMLGAYTALAGVSRDTDPGYVARSIIESIARRTAEVVDELAGVTAVDDTVLFGGAARMELLVVRLAELTGRPVRTGSAEAAALGNAIVQGIAIGAFADLTEGRRRVGTTTGPSDV